MRWSVWIDEARMLKYSASIISLVCFLFLSAACGSGEKRGVPLSGADTLTFRYAKHVQLVEGDDFSLAVIRNPWDTTRVLHTYILLPHDVEVENFRLPEGTIVRIPLTRSVVYSSVHCSLLDELGAFSAIAGVCDLEYIRLPKIHEAYNKGSVANLGSGMSPDVEKMIELHPDALLLSPFENSGGYGRVEQLGIPVIECADYMETSPLGRAEWMRFYGRLFGRAAEADSLFSRVERNYGLWAGMVAGKNKRPTLLCDLPMATSAWYVPGGNSTIGKLYADAGVDYLFASDEHSGSVPLSFETVLNRAQHADFWLIRYNEKTDKTYRSLQTEYELCTRFRAFNERRMYGCNTGTTSFYEEVPFHPDRLLCNIIRICHPELAGENDSLYYYVSLRE